jgi:hypothetical protein
MFMDACYSNPDYSLPSSETEWIESDGLQDIQRWLHVRFKALIAKPSQSIPDHIAPQWQQDSPQLFLGLLAWLPLVGVMMWLMTMLRSPAPFPVSTENPSVASPSQPIAPSSPAASPTLNFDLATSEDAMSDRSDLEDLDNPFIWPDSETTDILETTYNLFRSPDLTASSETNKISCSGCVQSSHLSDWLNSTSPDPLFVGELNSLVARAVGAAEGTRTVQGDRTPAYYGHTDPGNGVWNLGMFSYQHGAASPEEADRKQLERLHQQAQILRSLAIAHGIQLTNESMLNGIDLANQAPRAALSEQGGYVQRLREAYEEGYVGSEAILEARVHSYIDPMTNRWDAPGLGNTHRSIRADQLRRQTAIAHVIDDFTAEHGQYYAAHHPYETPTIPDTLLRSEPSSAIALATAAQPSEMLQPHSSTPPLDSPAADVNTPGALDFGLQKLS